MFKKVALSTSAMHEGYFEGILQLRNPNRALIHYVMEAIAKNGTVRIAKQKQVTNGIDFYLSSNTFLKQLRSHLSKRFAGELKTSATLHTRKNGRDLYRLTILFRLPHFKLGEKILFRGETYNVVSIGSRVLLKDVTTGRKKYFKFDDVEKSFRKA